MAQVFALFLILIQIHVFFIIFAMASETVHTVGEPNIAPSSSPSNHDTLQRTAAAAPAIRKLGKHLHKLAKFPAQAPHLSPSELPQTKIDRWHSNKEASSFGHQDPESTQLMQEIYLKRPHHHSSVDKSVAGGGVILGGLATTFFVAIFCYIRATGRNKAMPQPTSP